MQTSAIEADDDRALTLLVFVGASGECDGWMLLDEDGVVASGNSDRDLPAPPATTILAVPGEDIAIHWHELESELTSAQAMAVARLRLADEASEPISEMHVAVGRPEGGLTPIAVVPRSKMDLWLARAAEMGLDPFSVVPTPVLLPPPETGYVRRDRQDLADFRGVASAFAIEPDVAALLTDGKNVDLVDQARFERGLAFTIAEPALDLRQGSYVRRQPWRFERTRYSRWVILAAILALISLVAQIANILAYRFDTDRLVAETAAIQARATNPGQGGRLAFGPAAAILFDAVRATPNVEISGLDYRIDGSLSASVEASDAASFNAFVARLESSGLRVQVANRRSVNGRPAAIVAVRGG
jgi:general secretion pathway protein L